MLSAEEASKVLNEIIPDSLDETIKSYLISAVVDNITQDPDTFFETIDDTGDMSDDQATELCQLIATKLNIQKKAQPVRVEPPVLVPQSPKTEIVTSHQTIPSDEPQAKTEEIPPKISSHLIFQQDDDEDANMALHVNIPRVLPPLGTSEDVNLPGITITAHNAAKNVDVDLLVNATLRLNKGNRYGLVGKNGIGKSTLLKYIAKGIIPGFPVHLTSLLVQQEVIGNELSALQQVLNSDTLRTTLLREEQEILNHPETGEAGAQKLVEIYKRLSEIDSNSAEKRAKEILEGLSFNKRMMEIPTSQLSGGWRMRVALACALFIKPHFLLLDEPTNHLDLETVLWLQDSLQGYEGTIVIVSHDAAFLSAVTTDIIHFTKKRLDYYPCDFNSFEKVRQEKKLKKLRLQENLDKVRDNIKQSIKKMEKSIQNNPLDSKRAAQIASRKKKLNKVGLEKTENGVKWNCQKHGYRVGSINANGGGWENGKRSAGSILEGEDKTYRFSFPLIEELGVHGPILTLKDVNFAYVPNKTIISGVNLRIDNDSRIAILGRNGSGKSTLLEIIVGNLSPTSGEIFRYHNLIIGYFTQHHVDQLSLHKTPLEHLLSMFPDTKEQDMRGHLGSFGIHGSLAVQRMSTLSGGQKSRVVFAAITWREPHLIIMDEPTNHLDFDTIEHLTESIQNYNGAIIIVSHDQALISNVAEELYVVSKGSVKKFDGEFSDYVANYTSFQ